MQNIHLKELTQTELEAWNQDFDALVDKHKVVAQVIPSVGLNDKGIWEPGGKLLVMKKVEMVPKEEGVASPYAENVGNSNESTENGAEAN